MDGASSCLKVISNMYFEITSTWMILCMKTLDEEREIQLSTLPTGLLVHCSDRRFFGKRSCKCGFAIGFFLIPICLLFINTWTFSSKLGQYYRRLRFITIFLNRWNPTKTSPCSHLKMYFIHAPGTTDCW